MYQNLSPTKEQNIFKQNILTVMPNRDNHGRRMLLIELGSKSYYSTKVILYNKNDTITLSFREMET